MASERQRRRRGGCERPGPPGAVCRRDDAVAVVIAGFVLMMAGFVLVMVARDYRAGIDAVRAVERNPGSGFVNFLAGTALVFGGDPADALTRGAYCRRRLWRLAAQMTTAPAC